MTWGCIGSRGRGRLHFIPRGTTVNAEKYIEILEDKLHQDMVMQNANIFQQDKAPCHAAKSSSGEMELRSWNGQGTAQTSIPSKTCGIS